MGRIWTTRRRRKRRYFVLPKYISRCVQNNMCNFYTYTTYEMNTVTILPDSIGFCTQWTMMSGFNFECVSIAYPEFLRNHRWPGFTNLSAHLFLLLDFNAQPRGVRARFEKLFFCNFFQPHRRNMKLTSTAPYCTYVYVMHRTRCTCD